MDHALDPLRKKSRSEKNFFKFPLAHMDGSGLIYSLLQASNQLNGSCKQPNVGVAELADALA